jgi:hypothetical protein
MGFNATAKGGNFKQVPAGNYVARCYQLIDMGTQTSEKFGNATHKVRIGWEILDTDADGQPLTIDRDGQAFPMTVSADYTLSLNEKASLRKMLASWRGRDFTPDELKGFDVSKLLGAYCMVNVTQSEGREGKTYANVSTVTPLPKALAASKPAGVHKMQQLDLDKPDLDVFDSLPEFIQQRIQASPEWAAWERKNRTAADAPAPAMAGDMDDDIPF